MAQVCTVNGVGAQGGTEFHYRCLSLQSGVWAQSAGFSTYSEGGEAGENVTSADLARPVGDYLDNLKMKLTEAADFAEQHTRELRRAMQLTII